MRRVFVIYRIILINKYDKYQLAILFRIIKNYIFAKNFYYEKTIG